MGEVVQELKVLLLLLSRTVMVVLVQREVAAFVGGLAWLGMKSHAAHMLAPRTWLAEDLSALGARRLSGADQGAHQ